MDSLEIGKLYTCSEYHLLVFPTEGKAAVGAASIRRAIPATAAAWWSKELNCQVSYISAGQVFCVVEIGGGSKNDFRQVHVVAGECMGWINMNNWLNIKEVLAA